MAFLVQPPQVQKNVAGSFTIDYSDLALNAAIPSAYYNNTSNWKEVFVRVKHANSGQKNVLHFTLPGTTADLLVSDTCRAGVWGVEKVAIRDYDRGEVVLQSSDIVDIANYNFNITSGASHGDLYVGNGEEITIPSGGKRQYGDFVIESGGIVNLADGGGITEIEVLGYCKVSGIINASQGYHTGGTWSSTSVLGESLTHNPTQKAGGVGGKGEGATVSNPFSRKVWGSMGTGVNTEFHFQQNISEYGISAAEHELISIGTNVKITSLYVAGISNAQITWKGESYDALAGANNYSYKIAVNPADQALFDNQYSSGGGLTFEFDVSETTEGQPGGIASFGNGGGGSRSNQFGALIGGDAGALAAGLGAGQNDAAADAHGENGEDALTASESGSGGFKGAHGQGLYLKAMRIEGNGTINASGQKGGDGGDGGEFLSGGSLYANGAGGGAAGGDGGSVWLRHMTGTPMLTINVAGGDKGNRGITAQDAVDAGHGTAGSAGTLDVATY
jgi:hypothetical protein